MIPTVLSIWINLMNQETTKSNKLLALSAVLQVYASLLGMTEDDFKDLTYEIGVAYSGPLPDEYSQEVEEHYSRIHKYE